MSKKYDTTHTLKDNGDNTYTYTKYIGVNNSLDINDAQYFDTAVYVSHAEDVGIVSGGASSDTVVNQGRTNALGTLVISDADFNTDRSFPLSIPIGVDAMQTICGRNFNSTTQTDQGSGTTTTYRDRGIQSIYHFDSSGISGATAVAWKQKGGYMHTNGLSTGTSGNTEQHDHIDIIALKSNASSTTNATAHWNDFVGFSITPAWTSSDTTPYSSNVTIDAPYTFGAYVANPVGGTTQDQSITFNSDALTDINDDDDTLLSFTE